jgi:TolA-binding protein
MRPFSFVILAMSVLTLVSSCRTSQQARRTQRVERSVNSLGHDVDSLLIVEDRLINVIDSLTGLVDEDRTRIRTLEQEVTMLRARIDGRMPALPPPPRPSTSGQSYEPPAMAPKERPAETPSREALAIPSSTLPSPLGPTPFATRYTDALHAFNSGQYASALDAMQALEQEDTGSAYSANYLYWEGESLFALHRYNEALQKFSMVADRFGSSLKADDARFKMAESYERMNLPASARQEYLNLIAESPASEYVARAQARLKKLK